MIIDFHTHAFPEKIAPRALSHLSDVAGGLEYYTDGTVDGVLRNMERGGVDASVVLSIATNPGQTHSVNDFAAKINDKKRIFAFGSVHPDAPDVSDELERIRSLGMIGVKLHPDYQGFFVDDPKMKEIYKKISSLGLVTVFHAGVDFGFPPPYKCTPERLARALSWFDSPVVAAHFGGLSMYDDVLKYLLGRDVYFDTSFSYASVPKYYAEKIIERHGADKILFGTDTPWHTPEHELRLIDSLSLSPSEREQILCTNAKKLLGM